MCLRRQRAPTLHSEKLSTDSIFTSHCSLVTALTQKMLLSPEAELSADTSPTVDYWAELVDTEPLLSVVTLTGAARLCYPLLIATLVHMSGCVEWRRPMKYTIISCQRTFSCTCAHSRPGPYRKRPDTNLQTKRMRQELRITHSSLSNTFVHVFIPH